MLRMFERFDDVVPQCEIGRPCREMKFPADNFIEALLMQHLRDLVNRGCVIAGNHRALIDIGKQSDLLAVFVGDRPVAAAHDHIRLNTDFTQLFHAVLRRFGFDFSGHGQVGNERQVDVTGVVAALFDTHLPDRLQKRQRFDVTHGTADFDNADFGIIRAGAN